MVIEDGKLWCQKCKEYVDAELKEGIVHDLEFYFKYYIKHRKNKK